MHDPIVLQNNQPSWFGWLRRPLTWLVLGAIAVGLAFWAAPYILDRKVPTPLQNLEEELQIPSGELIPDGLSQEDITPALQDQPMTNSVSTGNTAATATGVGSQLTSSASHSVTQPTSPLIDDIGVTNVQQSVPPSAGTEGGEQANSATPQASTNVSVNADDMAAAMQAPLAIVASGESWVEVKNKKGIVVQSKTLNAGEVMAVNAEAPFTVKAGQQQHVKVYRAGVEHAFAAPDANGVHQSQIP